MQGVDSDAGRCQACSRGAPEVALLRLKKEESDEVRLRHHVRDGDALRLAADARQRARRRLVHEVEHRDAVRRLQVAPGAHAHLHALRAQSVCSGYACVGAVLKAGACRTHRQVLQAARDDVQQRLVAEAAIQKVAVIA